MSNSKIIIESTTNSTWSSYPWWLVTLWTCFW